MSATAARQSLLWALLSKVVGESKTEALFKMIQVDEVFLTPDAVSVPRLVLAQAMNMVLFDKNLEAVPEGKAYVTDKLAAGEQVVFDHGALRTVKLEGMGSLPAGELSFKRILEPLGFVVGGVYPLPKLKMTGRAYVHQEAPELVAQFFVSELHVDEFSPSFQDAVRRVTKDSVDPLKAEDHALLQQLAADSALPFEAAVRLLPALVHAFGVHHPIPALDDYNIILKESAEMAWISTEGNCFNHATDHVPDVFKLTEQQAALGRSIKPQVEVSTDGSVRQTAFRAAQVKRAFRDEAGRVVEQVVPGSFYEFITRDRVLDQSSGEMKMDLRFDSGNAQGIFKMTAAMC
ncbi:DUF1338 domain-containing protein [Leeia sp. TBRC 13508]|uniref:2-oxoadipate dioxygenase/decarboxylase n=1 Tax=Leeia speluncae TaxID=2884804 RepID=A0ABS8D8J8_9NEIS|nr:DUF1338 domain-containing protein [Leeia speluncae]MCB6184535.1 DUF1338 domain-containing protein [Leeia speluncae]